MLLCAPVLSWPEIAPPENKYDAIVTNATVNKKSSALVCQKNTKCFTSLQEAIDFSAASEKQRRVSGTWFQIFVAQGEYHEKVTVNKSRIKILGEGADKSVISNNLVAANARSYHRDNWGTPGSATLTINAMDVHLEKLGIENTFDYLANDKLDKDDPKRVKDSQAVALLLDIDSDRVKLNQVRLTAYQDTLFANGKRAHIKDSTISGNVDFIFGNGQLLIESSDIISRLRGVQFTEGDIQGHISAPSTQLSSAYGLVFLNSRLLREQGVPRHSHTLGRPWHPTSNFPDGRYADPNAVGYAAYINCYMDEHIVPQAWGSMNGTARDGTKSQVFTPEDSRFYERGSYGPGAFRENAASKHFNSSLSDDEIRKAVLGNWSS